MNNIFSKLQHVLQKRSVKYGFPFLILMVGGSFGIREFSSLKYKVGRPKQLTADEAEKYGIEMKKPSEVTLESEFEKIKNLDINNWEQKRGPRPWEEKIE